MSDRGIYPRPEYPRPDFQRGTIEGRDWLNLNGPWQFRFDPDRRGMAEGWYLPEPLDWREQILVPFCWESLAAWGEAEAAGNENYYATRVFRNPLEVNRANHSYVARHEVGWYRRRVTIPNTELWREKRVILKIGAADFFTDCWCNGIHISRHEGGYTPFEFDLTDALTLQADGSAEALLIIRVEDPMNNSEQPVGKQWHWYTPASGIWQTVYVEPRERSYIDAFRIYTDIDAKTATFAVECKNTGKDTQLILYIMPPAGNVEVVKVPVKNGAAKHTQPIPLPYLWSPEQPHLYKLVLKLQQGDKTLDYVQSYFGMRKIDAGPAEDPKAPAVLRLNSIPVYMRGALYQSYHPDGVYTAGDVETLKKDILSAKRFGFNFLRIHIKVDDPQVLYYADTLGIMLMADFPNFGEGGDTPQGRRRFEEMMRAAIRRDFNHPAIVAWCVFNETWGFGGQVEFVKIFPDLKQKILGKRINAPPDVASETAKAETTAAEAKTKPKLANLGSHVWVQSMWELAKSLDSTRLVEDMSVVHWEHLDYFAHGNTDINSWHFYINDYPKAKAHIEKIVGATYAGSSFNYVPGFQQKSQPLINSEYGGVGALDGDRDVSWSFKFLTNELRRHGQISAYIYTELHDVEWEYNGFLNYDRTPKDFGYDPRIINESDTLPVNAAPITRCAPNSVMEVEVASSHYSPRAQEKVSLRWRLGGMDTWGRIHQDLAKGVVPIAFPHRRVAAAHKIEVKVPDKPMLCTLTVEAIDPNGTTLASNFIQYFVTAGEMLVREETERTLVLRGLPSQWSAAQWSGPMTSVDQARALDCCYGSGHGFFEWDFPLEPNDLKKARRLRVLCEASSRRVDTPQTDDDHFPTTLHMSLNGVPIFRQIVVNHPHDTRGALSYLRGEKGAYGYLMNAAVEAAMLQNVSSRQTDGKLRLRLAVPSNELAIGGLSVYGPESGRYPICPMILVEW